MRARTTSVLLGGVSDAGTCQGAGLLRPSILWEVAGDYRERVWRGTLLYEGTYLSDELQTAILKGELQKIGLAETDQGLPSAVHVEHGVNSRWQADPLLLQLLWAEVKLDYNTGRNDLLDGKAVGKLLN